MGHPAGARQNIQHGVRTIHGREDVTMWGQTIKSGDVLTGLDWGCEQVVDIACGTQFKRTAQAVLGSAGVDWYVGVDTALGVAAEDDSLIVGDPLEVIRDRLNYMDDESALLIDGVDSHMLDPASRYAQELAVELRRLVPVGAMVCGFLVYPERVTHVSGGMAFGSRIQPAAGVVDVVVRHPSFKREVPEMLKGDHRFRTYRKIEETE